MSPQSAVVPGRRVRPDADRVSDATPWDRGDPTVAHLVLTIIVCLLAIVLPLGPSRFVLAAMVLVVQVVAAVAVKRATEDPRPQLGALLVVQHCTAVAATLITPAAYIGANLITIGSLGANASYLSKRWLRALGAVTALNTVAAPLFVEVTEAPVVIGLGLMLSAHTVMNRSGAVLTAEAIAIGAREQAEHDALTGLPNRRRLRSRLNELRPEDQVGLLLVDMNDFKEINDTLGHDFGDEVLCAVARRMSSLDEEILVVRLGGDEFAAVVPGDRAATQRVALLLEEMWTQPLVIRGLEIAATGATGMAHSDTVAADHLLRFADIAMYRAKNSGAPSSWYQSEDDPHSRRRLQLVHDLPEALRDGGVRPWFEPQVEIATGEVVGFEALARWRHDEFGLIGAGELLDLVALTGHQHQLAETVIVQSIRKAATWPEHMRVAVNVVASELNGQRLGDLIRSTLDRFGVDPRRLTIEIVEHEVDTASTTSVVHLAELTADGVSISLDDFGRAHSSLSRLDNFDVNEVKIDKSFVRHLIDRPSSGAIVDAIVGLAHRLDVRIVALGVDSEATAAAVAAAGIRVAQGARYGRPTEVPRLVAANSNLAGGPLDPGSLLPDRSGQ